MQNHSEGKAKSQAAELRLKNNRLGMSIFQASWIMAFLAIAIVNWQLRFSYAQWPPAGVAPFDPLLPSAATLFLLVSAFLLRRGRRSLQIGARAAFRMQWATAMGLGLVFMALIVYEFLAVSAAALATQYGITMRLMTGFHFVHTLAILALLLRVYRQSAAGGHRDAAAEAWAVEAGVKLWYFVTVAWLLFYIVLYWIR